MCESAKALGGTFNNNCVCRCQNRRSLPGSRGWPRRPSPSPPRRRTWRTSCPPHRSGRDQHTPTPGNVVLVIDREKWELRNTFVPIIKILSLPHTCRTIAIICLLYPL